MKINAPACSNTVGKPAVAALFATLLAGCTIAQAVPDYAEADASGTQQDAPPDLLPQEAFVAALETNLAQSATSLAANEALLARAARLNLWTGK